MMMILRSLLLLSVCLGAVPLLAEDSTPPPPPASPWTYVEPELNRENPKPFGLKLEYGQIHAAGKASYMSRSGRAGANYENGLDEVRLDVDSSYLKSDDVLSDDRRHAYFGYDRYIGSRLWLFLLHDWESNKPIGNNYTQLTGAGVKVDIMRNSQYTFNVGVAYLKRAKQTEYTSDVGETITSTKDDKVISARLKFGYETELTRFGLISFYQPVTRKNPDPVTGEEKEDYSWSVESWIAYNLTKRIYLKYAYIYRFESIRTGPGVSREDEKTTLQLGYEL